MCRGVAADGERVQVWEDGLWRLTVSLASEVPGFATLEPKRLASSPGWTARRRRPSAPCWPAATAP